MVEQKEQKGGGLLREIEKKLGLPPLNQVADSLHKFPDAEQLKLIKEVLTVAERVARSGPELENVLAIIRELNSMPVEKLDKLEGVLKKIEAIIKKAPEELMSFLTSLKEE